MGLFVIFLGVSAYKVVSIIETTKAQDFSNLTPVKPKHFQVEPKEAEILLRQKSEIEPQKMVELHKVDIPGAFLPKKETSYRELRYLMTSPVGRIDLCTLDCAQLDSAVVRKFSYLENRFDSNAPPEQDPAFQLAKIANQSALGPATRDLFELIFQIKEDRNYLRAMGIAKLLFRVEKIRDEFQLRGRERIAEAQALDDRLNFESRTCTSATWPQRCVALNSEISDWLKSGALE